MAIRGSLAYGRLYAVPWTPPLLGACGRLYGDVSIAGTTTYKELYRIAFVPDFFADYTVQLTDNGKLLHLQGGSGFGVTGAVEQVLECHEDIEGIILDSQGRCIYEGRQLASLISTVGLDTYSLTGCHSACGTAFISGERRYLAAGADLAFHQYYAEAPSLHDAALLRREASA